MLLLARATVAFTSGCGHRGSQEDILAASCWSFLAINFPSLTAGRGCDVIGQHLQNRLAVRRRLLAACCCWRWCCFCCRITRIGYRGFSVRSWCRYSARAVGCSSATRRQAVTTHHSRSCNSRTDLLRHNVPCKGQRCRGPQRLELRQRRYIGGEHPAAPAVELAKQWQLQRG
jgi:hypothetical protein